MSLLFPAAAAAMMTLSLPVPNFSTPSGPRHTPKISGRPPIGWRKVQRRGRFVKLSRRVRANRRAS